MSCTFTQAWLNKGKNVAERAESTPVNLNGPIHQSMIDNGKG
jgi:hypothetical protein